MYRVFVRFSVLSSQRGELLLTTKTEGPAKKNRRAPHPPTTHPPADLLFPLENWKGLLVRFGAFLGKGSTKAPYIIFANSPCQKLFPTKSTKISMSVFPRFFLFYRVFRCFPAMGVQKHHETRFEKNRVERFLQNNRQKNRQKNPIPIFFSICFIMFLGVSP
jgi:hypothetical protein